MILDFFASIICIGIGVFCLGFAWSHQTTWHGRLRHWKHTQGRLLGFKIVDEIEETRLPIIEYHADNEYHTFTSSYAVNTKTLVGDEVEVVYHPESGKAELLSSMSRWGVSLVITLFGVMLLVAGVGIFRQAWLAQEDQPQPVEKATLIHPNKGGRLLV